MDASKFFDFLNFFESDSSPRSTIAEVGAGRSKANETQVPAPKQPMQQRWRSDSTTTSPMSSMASSPVPPSMLTPPPKKTILESPEARPSHLCPEEGVKKRPSIRKRRSSVFFKLPDMGRVRNAAAVVADKDKKNEGRTRRSSRRSSHQRSRRASVAPGGESPCRTRTAIDDSEKDPPISTVSETSTAESRKTIAGDVASSRKHRGRRTGRRRTTRLRAPVVGEGGEEGANIASPTHGQRPSPRALSAGHRRESCRNGGFSRAPKGLSAEKLFLDALDVAHIRAEAGLRANYQGVCWIASNWAVGEKKGVLSGRRYLVLCDKIVWAELHEDAAHGDDGKIERNELASKEAGFLPIISLDGATVQHCAVANSNNGWVIEVLDPETNTTLWLDPENPTSLLRWGSVFCQAIILDQENGSNE